MNLKTVLSNAQKSPLFESNANFKDLIALLEDTKYVMIHPQPFFDMGLAWSGDFFDSIAYDPKRFVYQLTEFIINYKRESRTQDNYLAQILNAAKKKGSFPENFSSIMFELLILRETMKLECPEQTLLIFSSLSPREKEALKYLKLGQDGCQRILNYTRHNCQYCHRASTVTSKKDIESLNFNGGFCRDYFDVEKVADGKQKGKCSFKCSEP